ncbi:MAG: hypothetical protein ACREF9_04310 [Opitutaceae bacterium]
MLGVADERLDEIAAWEEVPARIREAILICCLVEKNGQRAIEPEAAASIARHFQVALNPVLMALGWMPPPPSMQLTELDRTVLRLVAAMDRTHRTAH